MIKSYLLQRGFNMYLYIKSKSIVKQLCKAISFSMLIFSSFAHATDGKYNFLFERNKPFLTICNAGELGNGLFRSAATISIALDNNYSFLISSGYKKVYPDVFHKFDLFKPAFNLRNVYDYQYLKLLGKKISPNTKLVGYPHSYLYFHHNKYKICDLFSPSIEVLERLKQKYPEIFFKKEKYVGIHIRTFARNRDRVLMKYDIVSHQRLGYGYYDKAINYFDKDSIFLVFSDCIECAKSILKKYDRKFRYINNTKLTDDFYLMSFLDKLIISNSTFCWWAAYLNPEIEKEIITPWPWYCHEKVGKKENWIKDGVHAICPPDWIEVPTGDASKDGFDNVIRAYLNKQT